MDHTQQDCGFDIYRLFVKDCWDDVPQFQYVPLQEESNDVRLVHILPASLSEDSDSESDWYAEDMMIQCEVRITALANSHACLSYCWGSPDDLQLILLNGARHYVRYNLYNFLVEARRTRLDEWLWIDAISIDQASISERNHQVRRMSQIFRQATCVYTWLDPGRMSGIGLVRFEYGYEQIHTDELAEQSPFLTPASTGVDDYQFRRILRVIFTNDYFNRTWTIAEVFLAQKLVFLSSHFALNESITRHMAQRFEVVKSHRDWASIRGAWTMLGERHRAESITLIKRMTSLRDLRLDCEDMRDRIYAILSIASDGSMVDVRYGEPIHSLFFRVLGLYCQKYFSKSCGPIIATHLRLEAQALHQYLVLNFQNLTFLSALLKIEQGHDDTLWSISGFGTRYVYVPQKSVLLSRKHSRATSPKIIKDESDHFSTLADFCGVCREWMRSSPRTARLKMEQFRLCMASSRFKPLLRWISFPSKVSWSEKLTDHLKEWPFWLLVSPKELKGAAGILSSEPYSLEPDPPIAFVLPFCYNHSCSQQRWHLLAAALSSLHDDGYAAPCVSI
jgi:hypothetical protein